MQIKTKDINSSKLCCSAVYHFSCKTSGTSDSFDCLRLISLSICNGSSLHRTNVATGCTAIRQFYFIPVIFSSCDNIVSIYIFPNDCIKFFLTVYFTILCKITSVTFIFTNKFYPIIPSFIIHQGKWTVNCRIFFRRIDNAECSKDVIYFYQSP